MLDLVASGRAHDEVPGKPTAQLSALEVVILYEDLGTALRAKRALDLLPDKFRAHTDLSTKLWRVELLTDTLLRERAAVEAAAADVIILSLHGGSGLRAPVTEWLGRWLNHKQDRPYAIGVLLDPELANTDGSKAAVASVPGLDVVSRVCRL